MRSFLFYNVVRGKKMVLFLTILTVLVDQLTKFQAVKYLKGRGPYKIIDNFFSLYYIENKGAAFGILQEKRLLFLILTTIVIIGLTIFIYRNYSKLDGFTKVALGLLLGGAIGNLIDRYRLGYVIDFLSFKLITDYSFPVFNFADVFIVISTIMIALIVIFEEPSIR